MTLPNSDNLHISEHFTTVVSDGAYVHLVEGFGSIIFYRDSIFPVHGTDGEIAKEDKKRAVLHEVRLAIPAIERLRDDIEGALKGYAALALSTDDRTIWGGPDFEDGKTLDFSPEDEVVDQAIINSYYEALRSVNKEGKKKLRHLAIQYLYDHMEEIRTIAKQYPKTERKPKQRITPDEQSVEMQ